MAKKQLFQIDKRTGRKYVYETDYKYDKVKKRTTPCNRKLIGHIDPNTGELVPNRETRPYISSPKVKRKFYGATYLCDEICKELGIEEDLKIAMPKFASELLSLAYYFVCEDSNPIYRYERWSKIHWSPSEKDITAQLGSEIFKYIDENSKEMFLRSQAKRHINNEYWFFDTTSISSYSETINQIRWGHNKDNRMLKQINLAVLIGKETGIPFYYRHYAGNLTDVSIIKKLIADIEFIKKGKAYIVLDRGFWSDKNVSDMIKAHIKFLIGTKTSLKFVKSLILANKKDLLQYYNYDKELSVFCITIPYQWKPNEQDARSYLHIYYSRSKEFEDLEKLDNLLIDLLEELKNNNRLEKNEDLYDYYFRKENNKYVLNQEVIDAEKELSGYFALFGNDAKIDAKVALHIYREKDLVEKCFANIKDRLDFRTPRTSSYETLNGKIFGLYLSLIILSWIKKKMISNDLLKKWTLPQLIDELNLIEIYLQDGKKPSVLEITKKQKQLYDALGIKLSK